MTLEEASARFGRMAAELPAVAAAVVAESLADALATAQALSSGTLTTRALRGMGHPYRHGGTPPQDPAIINRQGGVFYRAWQIEQGAPGGEAAGKVVNRSPQAEWLRKGTARMIARPTVERVNEQVAPRHEARAEAALLALLGG